MYIIHFQNYYLYHILIYVPTKLIYFQNLLFDTFICLINNFLFFFNVHIVFLVGIL